MAEARFCPSCGAERTAGAAFCAACGTAFAAPVPIPSAGPVEQPILETHDAAPAPSPAFLTQVIGPVPGRSSSGPISRAAALVIGVVVVLLVAVTAWGATTAQTLGTTQSQLANTSQQLTGSTTDLTASRAQVAQLSSDKTELTSANSQLSSDKTQLTAKAAQLTDQVSKQTQCIAALNANATELQRISGLATTNFNRNAKGSAWAKADTAALNDYYNAYSAAFSGHLSTANSWIAKGNTAIKTKSAQVTIIDKATKVIEDAETALSAALAQSAITCGF